MVAREKSTWFGCMLVASLFVLMLAGCADVSDSSHMGQSSKKSPPTAVITEFKDCKIFYDPVTSSRTPLRSPPNVLLALSHMFHSSSKPAKTPL